MKSSARRVSCAERPPKSADTASHETTLVRGDDRRAGGAGGRAARRATDTARARMPRAARRRCARSSRRKRCRDDARGGGRSRWETTGSWWGGCPVEGAAIIAPACMRATRVGYSCAHGHHPLSQCARRGHDGRRQQRDRGRQRARARSRHRGRGSPLTHCPPHADEVVDCRGMVVLPGLVNTHHHFFQTLTRAVPAAQDAELFGWLRTLYPMWSGLTPEMLERLGARRDGRAHALRLHHVERPPVSVSERRPPRRHHRRRARRSACASTRAAAR